jgi:glycosyltransferase involved in cell wall biosynthesis
MVSVIVPNFNHGKYLEQRINSILCQTYNDLELIILDDCSSDNSQSIIENYRDNNKVSKIIINKENSGSPFLQWELGLKHASGEYVWIAESDDLCTHDFLEQVISKFVINPNLIMSVCRTNHINEYGDIIAPNTWGEEIDPILWKNDFTKKGIDLLSNFLIYRNVIPNASSVLFRNNVLSEIKSVNELGAKYCGDWYFWFLLLKKGDFAFTSKYLNFQRSVGKTTRSIKPFFLEKKRFQEAIKLVLDIGLFLAAPVDFSDKKYLWIHRTYTDRISFVLKLNFNYWNLQIPRNIVWILFVTNLKYYYLNIVNTLTKGYKNSR